MGSLAFPSFSLYKNTHKYKKDVDTSTFYMYYVERSTSEGADL